MRFHSFILCGFLFVLTLEILLGLKLGIALGLSLKNAFLYVLLLLILFDILVFRKPLHLRLVRIHLPFLLLIIYATLSLIYTYWFHRIPNYDLLTHTIPLKYRLIDLYLFAFVAFYAPYTDEEALYIAKFFLWIIILANFISIIDTYNILNLGIIPQRPDFRSPGPIGEPNQYATLLSLFIPWLISLCFASSGLFKVIYSLSTILIFLGLFLTASRGGLLATFIGLVVLLFLWRRSLRLPHIIAAISLILIFITGAFFMLGKSFQELFISRFNLQPHNLDELSHSRISIWQVGINEWFKAPFVGRGWDSFKMLTAKHFPRALASHNTYLRYLTELGIIGLSLYLWLLIQVIIVIRKGLKHADGEFLVILRAFMAGFIGTLIATFFVNLYRPWWFVWAFVGLCLRIAVNIQTKTNEE